MAKPSQIPPQNSNAAILDWAEQAIKEGEAFLKSQPGYGAADQIFRTIMGEDSATDSLRPLSMSSLSINYIGKIALDLASSNSEIKPFWEYKTNNQRFEMQAQMAQKLASAWWTNRFIDIKFLDVNKYALYGGSGCAHQIFNEETQDLDMLAEDPRDVLPIRPSSYFSFQDCFGVCLRRERTVNYLKAMYPAKAAQIRADRDGSLAALNKTGRYEQIMDRLGIESGFVRNLFSSLGKSQAKSLNIPVADVYTIYVKDDSQNLTGSSVLMGHEGPVVEGQMPNWAYWVKPGEPLYPRKRLIVLTRSCILYDGPNIYWHGLFPVSKLTLDPWPGTWLGKSPLKDLLPLQDELRRMSRGVSDHFEKVWRPDMVGDKRVLSEAGRKGIDTRKAGLKLMHNPVQGKAIELVYPNPLEPAVQSWISFLITTMKELAGTDELAALSQVNQIPATETIEKIQESMRPAIRLRSRVMEAFLREQAHMLLMGFFQFYDKKKRLAILGPTGQTFEDFDYDPDTMVPDMLSTLGGDEYGRPLPRYERALKFIDQFSYHIAPGSLLNAASVTNKLLYVQLARMGFVDPITLLEQLDIPNVGAPEEAGTTIMQRLQWAQQQGVNMAVGPQGASSAGRKASNDTMPRMVMKTSS